MKKTFFSFCCFISSFFLLIASAATTNETICLNNNIVLTVPGDINEYVGAQWSPVTGLTNTNTLMSTFTPTAVGEYTFTFTAKKISAGLFPNGDFEMGNTASGLSTFHSDYTLATPNGNQTLFPEGRYTITTDVSAVHSHSQCRNDHTTGNGYMMAINGSSTPSMIVWQPSAPVAVLPNTDYVFSAWIMSWINNQNSPAILQFRINGQNINAPVSPPRNHCEWAQVYVPWNSGSNTFADITLLNMQTSLSDNDFAIDDISFALSQEVTYTFIIRVEDCTSTESITMCLEEQKVLNANDFAAYTNIQWLPAANLSSATVVHPTFTPTSAGLQTYVFTAKNAQGLTITKTFNIDVQQCEFTDSKATCVEDPLVLNAGDTTSYNNIRWSPTSELSASNVASPTFTPTSAGNFTYTMRAERGGLNIEKTVNVHVVECTVTRTHNVAFCAGTTDDLTITATAGTNHLWNTGKTTQTITVEPVNAQYTCTSTGNTPITSPFDQNFSKMPTNIDNFNVQVANISIRAPKQDLCIGEELTVTGVVNNSFWTTDWTVSDRGLTLTPINRTTAQLKADRTGNYTVNFEVAIPQVDAASSVCQSSLEITVNPSPAILSIRTNGRVLQVTPALNTGGSQPFIYVINDRDYYTQPIIGGLGVGAHRLVVINAEGCRSREVEFTIVAMEIVPDTFFSPNNDGKNDVWNIAGIDFYKDAIVEIYDRSGKLLAKYNGNFNGWDGKFNGKHLPSTDYWYKIKIDEINEKATGHFTLKR